MRGAIRKREILAHPVVTVQCFGWSVFFRAILAGRGSTFLSLLTECGRERPRTVEMPELLARCTAFEERAQRFYAELARRFTDVPNVADLFETLSRQEAQHAELLRVCGELATKGGGVWRSRSAELFEQTVDRADRRLGDEEARAGKVVTVVDALRAAIRVELSEVNDAFALAVDATDSAFVRTLDAFRVAEDEHLSFLYERVVSVAPELAGEAGKLLRTAPVFVSHWDN